MEKNSQLQRALKYASEEEKRDVFTKLISEVPIDEVHEEIEQRTGTVHHAEYLADAQERIKNWGKFMGLSSGYSGFDPAFKGFVEGEVTILGGYTSHGKTQVAANFAYNIAKAGHAVLFVTLEMTHAEIETRFLRMAMDDHVEVDEFAAFPLYYQIQQSVDYKEVKMIAERAKEDKAEIVFVDYLQYMTGDNTNEQAELTRIIKSLKRQALETKLPFVVLSQFKRPEREGKQFEPRPNITSFKGTSAIEQAADIAIYAWREDRQSDMIEIGVLKNRNRGIGTDPIHVFQSIHGAKMNYLGAKEELPDDEDVEPVRKVTAPKKVPQLIPQPPHPAMGGN